MGTGTLRPIGPGQAEVVRVSVASSSRRTGTGSQILNHLVRISREQSIKDISLETTSSWSSAVRFYTRHGFIKTHEQGNDSYFT